MEKDGKGWKRMEKDHELNDKLPDLPVARTANAMFSHPSSCKRPSATTSESADSIRNGRALSAS